MISDWIASVHRAYFLTKAPCFQVKGKMGILAGPRGQAILNTLQGLLLLLLTRLNHRAVRLQDPAITSASRLMQ